MDRTARCGSAAVHIPELGDLVLGGTATAGDLPNAELLEIMPSALYFYEAVYVDGMGGSVVQMLSLPQNQPGQWTLIFS